MPQYNAPGVYVEEVEQGGKPIEGVGTSTPGFLGETERGPEQPRLVTSGADFRRLYGGPIEGRFLPQAVEGFFQNGGSRCYVGRVTSETAETATGHLAALGAAVGKLQPDADTLQFGRVAADQTPTEAVDVEPMAELGDETVTITDLAVINDPNDDFELTTELPSEGLSVAAGEPASLAVTFTHTSGSAGTKSADLEITATGEQGAQTQTVSLTGTVLEHDLGTADNDLELGYTTSAVEFGPVGLDETAARTVTVQNLGDASLTLDEGGVFVDANTTPFSVLSKDSYDGRTLESGDTVDVTVTMSPTATGSITEYLKLTYAKTSDDTATGSATITLDAEGVLTDDALTAETPTTANDGEIATAGGTVDTGTFVAGNTRSITLHNRGTKPVSLTGVTWTGDADAFRLLDQREIDDDAPEIPGGESMDLTVRALSTDAAASTATMTVNYEYQQGGTTQTGSQPVTIDADIVDSLIELTAVGPGDWGAGVAVTVVDGSLYDPDANDFFRVAVRYWRDPADRADARAVLADPDLGIDAAPDPDVEEIYDNLTPDANSSDHYGTTIGGTSTLVDIVDENSQDNGPRPANGTVWLGGRFPDDPVEASDYEGDATDPSDRTGFAAFEQVDEIAMVAVPDEHAYTSPLSETIVNHCLNQGDRFAILNSPPSPSPPGSLQPTQRSDFAAFYYPWLTIGHPETGRDQDVPPCGHVAGIYARSDQERGVHKAPANEQVRGIRDLQKTVSKGDQASLNPRGVNCIRTFRGRGTRVWGARTTSSDPAWKYVNVRRLFLFVEESIDEGTQWVVFEPNNEQLWARVRQTIRNFLTSVWQDGALMGSTPEEAFYVKCDRSTMTQNDIDNGRLICEIGIAPVKPAEFVVLRISQKTAGGEA